MEIDTKLDVEIDSNCIKKKRKLMTAVSDKPCEDSEKAEPGDGGTGGSISSVTDEDNSDGDFSEDEWNFSTKRKRQNITAKCKKQLFRPKQTLKSKLAEKTRTLRKICKQNSSSCWVGEPSPKEINTADDTLPETVTAYAATTIAVATTAGSMNRKLSLTVKPVSELLDTKNEDDVKDIILTEKSTTVISCSSTKVDDCSEKNVNEFSSKRAKIKCEISADVKNGVMKIKQEGKFSSSSSSVADGGDVSAISKISGKEPIVINYSLIPSVLVTSSASGANLHQSISCISNHQSPPPLLVSANSNATTYLSSQESISPSPVATATSSANIMHQQNFLNPPPTPNVIQSPLSSPSTHNLIHASQSVGVGDSIIPLSTPSHNNNNNNNNNNFYTNNATISSSRLSSPRNFFPRASSHTPVRIPSAASPYRLSVPRAAAGNRGRKVTPPQSSVTSTKANSRIRKPFDETGSKHKPTSTNTLSKHNKVFFPSSSIATLKSPSFVGGGGSSSRNARATPAPAITRNSNTHFLNQISNLSPVGTVIHTGTGSVTITPRKFTTMERAREKPPVQRKLFKNEIEGSISCRSEHGTLQYVVNLANGTHIALTSIQVQKLREQNNGVLPVKLKIPVPSDVADKIEPSFLIED